MKFPELLIAAIQRAEIPLRFEPGAEEAVAKPVTEILRAWVSAHMPPESDSEFDSGYRAWRSNSSPNWKARPICRNDGGVRD